MAKFDEMLKELHDKKGTVLTDAEANEPIVVNSLRQFEVPKGYNLTIAYEGDVNSQKITFKLPRIHEGHDLADCSLKVIRWKNTNIKAEDSSNLKVVNIDAANIIVEWIVPPAAFVAAGNIEVAITFYDILNGSLAFSWNTAAFSGFKVEKTLSQVGKIPTNIAPAKNEILYIDEENHNIVAPNGYNFIVSTFGNRKTTKVYFQTTATVGGIPIINDNTTVSVIASLNGESGTYDIPSDNISPSFSTSEETGEGLVNFVWNVPTEITCNNMEYVGEFSIAIKIEHKEIQTISETQTEGETQTEDNIQVWKTVPFTKLALAKSLFDSEQELLSDKYTTIVDAQQMSTSLPRREVAGISLFRRDTAEGWDDSEYVAEAGETIIYLPGETTGYRVKYGNGVDMVKNLPFQTTIYVMTGEEGEELPEGYEVYLDPSVEPYAYKLTEEEKEDIAEKVKSDLEEYASPIFVKKSEGKFYKHNIHLQYHYVGKAADKDGDLSVFFTLINNDSQSYDFVHQWNLVDDSPINETAAITNTNTQTQLKRLHKAIWGNFEYDINKEHYRQASGIFGIPLSESIMDNYLCSFVTAKYFPFSGDPCTKRLITIRGTKIREQTGFSSFGVGVIEISCGGITGIEDNKEVEYDGTGKDAETGSEYLVEHAFTSHPIRCMDEVELISSYELQD